jgi:hypothetical protein
MGLNFSIYDTEDRFGGQISLTKEYGNQYQANILDTTTVWVKPFNWIRLDVGTFQSSIFQGSMGGNEFSSYIGPSDVNDPGVFQDFHGVKGSGVLVSLYPIPNLTLGALVNPRLGARYDTYRQQTIEAADVYKNGQYAAAYTIPNIGTARIQYIGGYMHQPMLRYSLKDKTDDELAVMVLQQDYYGLNMGTIGGPYPITALNIADTDADNNATGNNIRNPLSLQAAFAYTGIRNLTLDMGLTYPLPLTNDYGSVQRPLKLSFSASYRDERLSLSGKIGASFLGNTKINEFDYRYVDQDSTGDQIMNPYLIPGDLGYGVPIAYRHSVLASTSINHGFSLNFSAGVNYMFDFGTTGLEFSLNYQSRHSGELFYLEKTGGSFENDHFTFGFGAWIGKTLGSASIKMGLAVSPPSRKDNTRSDDMFLSMLDLDRYEKGPWVITVPIIFGYYL